MHLIIDFGTNSTKIAKFKNAKGHFIQDGDVESYPSMIIKTKSNNFLVGKEVELFLRIDENFKNEEVEVYQFFKLLINLRNKNDINLEKWGYNSIFSPKKATEIFFRLLLQDLEIKSVLFAIPTSWYNDKYSPAVKTLTDIFNKIIGVESIRFFDETIVKTAFIKSKNLKVENEFYHCDLGTEVSKVALVKTNPELNRVKVNPIEINIKIDFIDRIVQKSLSVLDLTISKWYSKYYWKIENILNLKKLECIDYFEEVYNDNEITTRETIYSMLKGKSSELLLESEGIFLITDLFKEFERLEDQTKELFLLIKNNGNYTSSPPSAIFFSGGRLNNFVVKYVVKESFKDYPLPLESNYDIHIQGILAIINKDFIVKEFHKHTIGISVSMNTFHPKSKEYITSSNTIPLILANSPIDFDKQSYPIENVLINNRNIKINGYYDLEGDNSKRKYFSKDITLSFDPLESNSSNYNIGLKANRFNSIFLIIQDQDLNFIAEEPLIELN